MGVRHALFPVLAFGAIYGCQLPDAILHGKRSFRPRSRAVQCLAVAELSSEAFQLASADGCATGLRTRSRHVCSFTSRLNHLAPGRPPLLTVRLPEATGLASYLSGCLSSTARRYSFQYRRPRKVFTGLARTTCPSRKTRSFCPAFQRLSLGGSISDSAVAAFPC